MGSGTEKTRLGLFADIDDQLGAKSKVKRLLAVLSARNASGSSSRAGRTEAGAQKTSYVLMSPTLRQV